MKTAEQAIEDCKRLSEIVYKNPSSKNLSLLYKAIKEAKAVQKLEEDIIKTKREIMKLEVRARKERTHKLIILGAEYYRVFQNYDPDKARQRFEQLQQSELEQILEQSQDKEHGQGEAGTIN